MIWAGVDLPAADFLAALDAHKAALAADQARPTVVCAWCGRVISEGNPALLKSHGICQDCQARVESELTGEAGQAERREWSSGRGRSDFSKGPEVPVQPASPVTS